MQCNGRAGGAGHRPGLRRGLHRPHGIRLARSSRRRSSCHGVSIHRRSLISLPSSYPAAIAVLVCWGAFVLWWSVFACHALALPGPGVACPSGRFGSRHQLTAPKRQPWLQTWQLYLARHPPAVGVWALHCPLGSRGQAMPIAFVSPKWKNFSVFFSKG